VTVILPKGQFALGEKTLGFFLERAGEIHAFYPQAAGLFLHIVPLGVG
jgi:hypothetical protein